ncbi:protein kinase, partial [Helicosporidium sp. ATCC 50920]
KPGEGTENGGWDNEHGDLIVSVGDVFEGGQGGHRYLVLDVLGQGTFGQVFRCQDLVRGGVQAVKVIKNQAAYFHQARVEIGVLQFLNTRVDPQDEAHIVRLRDFFVHRNHLCLCFELLHLNLYELVRQNRFRGFSLSLVRVFIAQVLQALCRLREARIIHCDLKPENVLLKNARSGAVKVIDFGSACFDDRTVYSYIQSRFYRSPEVVLGAPYTLAIDVWSLGCMAAELFLGLPLFPAASEHDLLSRITSCLGPLPDALLSKARNAHKFFSLHESPLGARVWTLRSREAFEALSGAPAPAGKAYFAQQALADIVAAAPH